MGYECRIEADSISPAGHRLVTWVVKYPRIIHSELLTHRMFSRNSSSSRAIPVERLIKKVADEPFVPQQWAKNQKGMQAGEEFDKHTSSDLDMMWLFACAQALRHAKELADLGVHKQWVNRLLEPWTWIDVVITATHWNNFFALRCHPAAQPEIRTIAEMMRES